jgi:hypothetical protein
MTDEEIRSRRIDSKLGELFGIAKARDLLYEQQDRVMAELRALGVTPPED